MVKRIYEEALQRKQGKLQKKILYFLNYISHCALERWIINETTPKAEEARMS